MRFAETIPLLRIFDVERARDFYLGFLGFGVDWEHRPGPLGPLYLQVARDGCILHLTEHHGDCCPGSTVLVRMTGLDAFHSEISKKGYPYSRPAVEPAAWGGWVMEVIDPFGNRIRFAE